MLLSKRIVYIIFITILIITMQIMFSGKVNASQSSDITLTYKYNDDNTVTAIAKSSVGFKETKPTWTLSKDKFTYTKLYYTNESYYTTFVLKNGVTRNIKLNITNIDDIGPNINMIYEYDEKEDAVTAIMKSNEKMANTKPTWTLSKDKLTYTKKYYTNQSYYTYVEDELGNKTKVMLNINKIKGPQISMSYQYNENNNTVTAIMTSNKALEKTKPTWTLSKDKLTYTKTFDKNQIYTTPVVDTYGNSVNVKVSIIKVDVTGPKITITYDYNEEKSSVIVSLKSNEKMANTKPTWTLSKDGLTYTKKYDSNQSYTTTIKDMYGNSTNVKLNITGIKDKVLNGIDVSLYQGTIDWAKVKYSGIDFAMIRAGYRGYGENGTLVEDSMFSKNILGAKSNGISVGIYFYTQAITEKEAKEEANFVLSLIKKYGVKPEYPIAIDTELSPVATGRADNLSKEVRTKIVKTFCKTIQDAGYTPMVYANKYWLNDNLNISDLSNIDTWLAHYTNKTDYKYPYTIWQYSDKGNINGITGNVDLNYGYKKYN